MPSEPLIATVGIMNVEWMNEDIWSPQVTLTVDFQGLDAWSQFLVMFGPSFGVPFSISIGNPHVAD